MFFPRCFFFQKILTRLIALPLQCSLLHSSPNTATILHYIPLLSHEFPLHPFIFLKSLLQLGYLTSLSPRFIPTNFSFKEKNLQQKGGRKTTLTQAPLVPQQNNLNHQPRPKLHCQAPNTAIA